MARRLFNSESELDEILRSQTFSLLHMQVPDGTSDDQKLAAAKVAGETIGRFLAREVAAVVVRTKP